MLKYLFALIILIHGLIHFMGFAKAFGYGNITQLTKYIPKPLGTAWLICAFLFIITIILYLLKKEAWPVIAIIAAVVSQALIITVWKDARFGAIANLLLLLVAIPSLAVIRFNRMVKKEVTTLLSVPVAAKTIITTEMISGLPEPVQKWLKQSAIIGKESTQFVRLQQTGEMRTKPGGKWLPLTATQYFAVQEPAFNWQTTVNMMPLVSLCGRDKLENGEGEMLIKALGLINVANSGHEPKINESSLLRYLAEICWFPSAALNPYIKWEATDSVSAKATITCYGLTASGIFRFRENGDLESFSAKRYMGGGKKASLENWFIQVTGYKEFEGMRIPHKNSVSWQLKDGDFNWLNLELTKVEYNNPKLFD